MRVNSSYVVPAIEPPSAELRGEAAVMIDIHMRVLESDPAPTSDGFARRSASAIWTQELVTVRRRVLDHAIRDYLRFWPLASTRMITDIVHDDNERDVQCTFCRASLNTFARSAPTPEPAFWRPIYEHAQLCAFRFLAGQIRAAGPKRNTSAVVLGVSLLNDHLLVQAVREAEQYLDETLFNHTKLLRTIPRGIVTPARTFVRRARKQMAERAKIAHREAEGT